MKLPVVTVAMMDNAAEKLINFQTTDFSEMTFHIAIVATCSSSWALTSGVARGSQEKAPFFKKGFASRCQSSCFVSLGTLIAQRQNGK